MNAAEFDQQDKPVRNLRATLAVVIAKLKINQTNNNSTQERFMGKIGLLRYIQNLVTQAMEGKDDMEIPDFFYDRDDMQNYPALKQTLSAALTDLQRLEYDNNLTLDQIYRSLINNLRDLETAD
ncbi:MAG: hypothetical protein MUD08_16275 [Cytophagales bacterium]|jgi:hypothetical protein|nr:hypothetical protein [Cytophagales bacterium]